MFAQCLYTALKLAVRGFQRAHCPPLSMLAAGGKRLVTDPLPSTLATPR